MSLLDHAPTPAKPTGCTAPKVTILRKPCGCVSEIRCICGHSDRRQEHEHSETTCRRGR